MEGLYLDLVQGLELELGPSRHSASAVDVLKFCTFLSIDALVPRQGERR